MLIGARGVYRVQKKIEKAAIATIPEIDPGLRILMREQRAAADELVVSVLIEGALPGVPGFRRNGMSGRADGQNIEQAQFAISVPLVLNEAFSVTLAVREQHRIAIQHPLEIHAAVDFARELGNLGIVGKILPGRENAGQKKRGIH